MRECLYCPNRAAKGEHVFPAALGGRIKSGNVICRPCNKAFGNSLDGTLPAQLAVFLGLAGVIGDNATRPRRAFFRARDGELHVSLDAKGGVATHGEAKVTRETAEGDTRWVTVNAPSDEAFARWRAEHDPRGQGRLGEREVVRHLLTKPVTCDISFGGSEGMRAVARIALNMFAYYFPEEARAFGTQVLRKYILGETTETGTMLTWFDPARGDALDPPRSDFGHRVLLGIDAKARRAFAHVTLFAAIDVGVDLGPVDGRDSASVLVHIDPLGDARASEHPGFAVLSGLPHGGFGGPPGDVTHAQVTPKLQGFFDRAIARQNTAYRGRTRDRLAKASSLPSPWSATAAIYAIARESQILLNLLVAGHARLLEVQPTLTEFGHLVPLTDKFVQVTDTRNSGVTHATDRAISELALQLAAEAGDGSDEGKLEALLFGLRGEHLASRVMLLLAAGVAHMVESEPGPWMSVVPQTDAIRGQVAP